MYLQNLPLIGKTTEHKAVIPPPRHQALYYVSTYELAILYGVAVLNRSHFWKVCKSEQLEGVYRDKLSLAQKSKPGNKTHLEQYKNINEMSHHL